jgi:N-acetylmuramoyl-L-alanine amidase
LQTGMALNKTIALVILLIFGAMPKLAAAQQLQALARLDVANSSITSRISGDVDVVLKLTQAVPYRVFRLDEPARLVLDFREVQFSGLRSTDLINTTAITGLRHGLFRPGWSRLVLEMAAPLKVHQVEMETDVNEGDATIRVRLTPQGAEEFHLQSGAKQDGDVWALPASPEIIAAKTRPLGDRKIVVVLDPGHGGIDPGAQYQGHVEANLMLKLAREMKDVLVLSGNYEVALTREEDVFLSLQGRITKARELGADVFISLHADALAEGTATGTTVYTLSENASDEAAASLAISHQRSDLLAGVDLRDQDDLIASILMDMVRLETMPRSEALADAIVVGIADAIGKIRSRPRLSAGFSVLKAPDIPSVLIEFGFMSNPKDLANLANAEWRAKAIRGLKQALDDWSIKDAAQARLLRQ